MDDVSEHEMLRKQLEQLKKELALKERKFMKMERIAQARKRLSEATAKDKLCIRKEGSDHMRQNISSDTSMNTSANDSLLGNETVGNQKYRMGCGNDNLVTTAPNISPHTSTHQEKHAAGGLPEEHPSKRHVALSHESSSGNRDCSYSLTRKIILEAVAKEKLLVVEKESDRMGQNTSSDTSINTSTNDFFLGNETMNNQKHSGGYNNDNLATAAPKISPPHVYKRQKEHIAGDLPEEHHCKNRMTLSHKSGAVNKNQCSTSTSCKLKKLPSHGMKDTLQIKVLGSSRVSDQSPKVKYTLIKKHEFELPIASGLAVSKKSVKRSSHGTGSTGIQTSSSHKTECIKSLEAKQHLSSSVELPITVPNQNETKGSDFLRGGMSAVKECIPAKQFYSSRDEKMLMKQKLKELEQSKGNSAFGDFTGTNIPAQKKQLAKTPLSVKVIHTGKREILSKDLSEKKYIATPEHFVTGNTSLLRVDTDHNKYPPKKSKFHRTKEQEDTDWRNNFSKETLVSSKEHESKAEIFSPAADTMLEKAKESFELNSNENDKNVMQCTSDTNRDRKLIQTFSDDINSPSCSSSQFFRRSRRLAKRNSSTACEGKEGRSFQSIGGILHYVGQFHNFSDIVDFELPSYEFGLFMEIKRKNCYSDEWPSSPSETFETIISEDFVPDSEEGKEPYHISTPKLCSSLSQESEKFKSKSESPIVLLKVNEEAEVRPKDSDVAVKQKSPCALPEKSDFQELPEAPIILNHCESQTALGLKKFESDMIFETDDSDLDIDDVKKVIEDKELFPSSYPCDELVNDELMPNAAYISVLQKQTDSPSDCNKNENAVQSESLYTDAWTSLIPASALGPSLMNKTDAVVLNSEILNDQNKSSAVDGNLAADVSASGEIFETSEVGPQLRINECDFHFGDEGFTLSTGTAPDRCHRDLSFLCCLETQNKEPVKRIHILPVDDEMLIVIQCETVIEIWKKFAENEWTRSGIYNSEDASCIEKSCLLTKEKCVIFVLLIRTINSLDLKFLLFDESLKVIQVKESKQNKLSVETRLLLCGLDGLTFATAEGSESSSLEIHFMVASNKEPYLMSRKLGDLHDCLLGLSGLQNASKALMAWSVDCMYIWNYISGNIVAVINLIPRPLNPFDKCMWAKSEEGLLFLLMTSDDENSLDTCELIAVNPMTGLWDIIQSFRHTSHEEYKMTNKSIDGVVLGRHVVLSCCQSGHVWDLYTGSHIASLVDCNVTSVMCASNILAIGLQSGCINLYSLYLRIHRY